MAKRRANYKGPRQPNGQPSRAKDPSRAQLLRPEPPDEQTLMIRAQKQAAAWGVRMTDREGKTTLKDEKRETYIGILRMLAIQSGGAEGISEKQFRAGEKAMQIWRAYCTAIDVQNGRGNSMWNSVVHEHLKDDERPSEWRLSLSDEEKAGQYDKDRAAWQKLRDCALDLQQEERCQKYIPLLHAIVTNSMDVRFSIGDIRSLLNVVNNRFMEAPKRRVAA